MLGPIEPRHLQTDESGCCTLDRPAPSRRIARLFRDSPSRFNQPTRPRQAISGITPLLPLLNGSMRSVAVGILVSGGAGPIELLPAHFYFSRSADCKEALPPHRSLDRICRQEGSIPSFAHPASNTPEELRWSLPSAIYCMDRRSIARDSIKRAVNTAAGFTCNINRI